MAIRIGNQLVKPIGVSKIMVGSTVVWQAEADSVSVDPNIWGSPSTGGSKAIAITANGAWTAQVSGTGLSINKTSGSGNDTITVQATENTGAETTGTLTITRGTAQATVDLVRPAYEISIQEASLLLPVDGYAQTIHVNANGNWSLSFGDQAFSASPASGSAGSNIAVQVSAAANTGDDRSTTLTGSCGSATDTAAVGQYGPFTLSQSSLLFVAAGEQKTFDLDTVGSWTISVTGTGFSVDKSSGTGPDTITVTAAQNTGSERSGTVSAFKSTQQLDVLVSQAAAQSDSASVPSTTDSFKATGVVSAKSQVVTSSAGWYAVSRNSDAKLGTATPPADNRMPTSGTLASGESVRYVRGATGTVGTHRYIDIYVGSTLCTTIDITLTA